MSGTVTGRLWWPVSFGEAIRFELTGDLPLDVERVVVAAQRAAYRRGRLEALERVAVDLAELDVLGAGWRRRARVSAEDRVQERLAEMERHAERMARRLGRPPGYVYRGGPVDWETGRPVRRLEAA